MNHIDWQPIATKPAWDRTPGHCFVWLAGWKYHSEMQWGRHYWGVVPVRKGGPCDFDGEALERLAASGDMDHWEITHWAPAQINRPASDPSEPPHA